MYCDPSAMSHQKINLSVRHEVHEKNKSGEYVIEIKSGIAK